MPYIGTPEFEAKRPAFKAKFDADRAAFEARLALVEAETAPPADTMSPEAFLARLREDRIPHD
jgi:hypothetical protein